MTKTIHRILDPEAPQKLAQARHMMRPGAWNDQAGTVCVMSALVPGATSSFDCRRAGYPRWLTAAITALYDAKVAVENPTSLDMIETDRANHWALSLAPALATPTDLDGALDRFLIRLLTRLQPIDTTGWCQMVRDLYERRLSGAEVQSDLLTAAHNAATDLHPVPQHRPEEPETMHHTAFAAAFAADSTPLQANVAVCASEAAHAWGDARGRSAMLWERWLQRLDLKGALKDSSLPG